MTVVTTFAVPEVERTVPVCLGTFFVAGKLLFGSVLGQNLGTHNVGADSHSFCWLSSRPPLLSVPISPKTRLGGKSPFSPKQGEEARRKVPILPKTRRGGEEEVLFLPKTKGEDEEKSPRSRQSKGRRRGRKSAFSPKQGEEGRRRGGKSSFSPKQGKEARRAAALRG